MHDHFVTPFEVLRKNAINLWFVKRQVGRGRLHALFYTCICRVDSLVVGWVKAMNTCICFVTILLNILCLKNGQTIVLKTYP